MLLKPTSEEIKRIKLDFSSTPIKNCSICLREDPPSDATNHNTDDSDDESNVVDWAACSQCTLWFHIVCLGNFNLSEEFKCFLCEKSEH